MSKYIYFVPSIYEDFVKTCTAFFNSPEPGTVISAPKNGMMQRVEQLVQDYADCFDRPLVQLDLNPSCEDMYGAIEQVKSKGYIAGKDNLYLLVTNATYALNSSNVSVIDDLIHLQYDTKTLKTIFFFEKDITNSEIAKLFRQTHIFTQIYYYPLYSRQDAEAFIYYSADELGMPKPPKRIVSQIVSQCAGQMWLLRSALREYRINPLVDFDQLLTLSSMQFRLGQIASSFTEEEIYALMGRTGADKKVTEHLTKLHLLEKGRCVIPLLYDYLHETYTQKKLALKDGLLFVDDVNVKHSFTLQETALLSLFIKHPNSAITRDQVADTLWRQEADAKYSEWAIEQLIKRIRTKLIDLGFSKSVIKTVRGVGYRYDG